MLKPVNPYEIAVSELNERQTEGLSLTKGDGEGLQESVAKHGVIQPPLVREVDDDAEVNYEVIVGQRRVLAAQGADLDEIPVVVMDLDDPESIIASIGENIKLFREEVGAGDRARALQSLWEARGNDGLPSPRELAEELGGVSETTISSWLEPLRREWKTEDDVSDDPSSPVVEDLANNLGDAKMREIRLGVRDRDLDAQEVATAVMEADLSMSEVKALREHLEADESVEDAIEMATAEPDEAQEAPEPSSGANVTIERVDDADDEADTEPEEPREVDTSPVPDDDGDDASEGEPENPWEAAATDGGATTAATTTASPHESRGEVHVSMFVRGADFEALEAFDEQFETEGDYAQTLLVLLRERAVEDGVLNG